MYHPSQMSGPQSPPPIQPGPPAGMQHPQQHHYPPPPGTEPQEVAAQVHAAPQQHHPQYPAYDIQLKYPPQYNQQENQPPQQYNPAQGLPLPSMSTNGHHHLPSFGTQLPPPPREQLAMDTTGQVAPPGMKPRVTATLWEDEGTLCFQVDVKGTCVARREDNHMINGTKLLNVAGMTRGRRDGILKAEKQKHVVKIGPMHLKGVWIPFEKALEFANKEKITEMLYPLFVHNIGALLYHPVNHGHAGPRFGAAVPPGGGGPAPQPPSMMNGNGATYGGMRPLQEQPQPGMNGGAPHPQHGGMNGGAVGGPGPHETQQRPMSSEHEQPQRGQYDFGHYPKR